jgi:TRAP-type uncharacterized transport system substrate-binding protein
MYSPRMKERFQRVLGLPQRAFHASTGLKTALLGGLLVLISLLVVWANRAPTLSNLRVAILSGSARGNYYAIVNTLAAEARQQQGQIDNLVSAGSVENIARLLAAQSSCTIHFALVQEGMDWPAGHPLELIGRLSKAESLVFLGPDADRLRVLSDLRGKRIGIGPSGSGTARLVRQVFAPLAELDLRLSTHSLDEQFAKLADGELDLGAMVIDEDARLLTEAVRDRQLQLLNLPDADVLARRLPFTRVGRIAAGQYDPVRQLPGEDKRVLRVDTLLVGNRCARRSATQALMTVLSTVFPDFVRENRDKPNWTGLRWAPAARSYVDNEGPDVVGVYAPWVVDLMPTASWLQLIFGLSLLFNAMSLWHRFRLWRIDAHRVRAEGAIALLFGAGITVGEITEMPPRAQHRTPEARAQLEAIMDQLATLSDRCRRHSLSMLVPMGQEFSYRYQEALIADLLYALRAFRDRLER